MNFLTAIFLGIVEGLTEFLPVSSTGHLILASRAFGVEPGDFTGHFTIAIQLGAILAVVFLYGKTLLKDKILLAKVAVAFIPTSVIGLLLYRLFKHFLAHGEGIVCASLFVGGIFLILFERFWQKKRISEAASSPISFAQAFGVGVLQTISIIPGVSRSAATIVAGIFLGMDRQKAVEFSFFLAIPTLAAATALDLFKNKQVFSSDQLIFLAAGFLTSFFVAIAAIKFLIRFVKTHSFIPFGVYRIAIAVIFFLVYLR